ncbi:dihydrofolate reductase [Defluviitalea phaphyphila]|uniref:dihydrofolate reductase n=1 Tax=Defluviitalea phaphyphila TaxID=1473580 RepID=UPI000730C6C7|nr:dihydrofolate reductase [Defluviitalea phaphyphila]
MNAIVAVDKNWGIGCRGDLLKVIPEDMKQFREKTLGKVVIMGRNTFESLPNKKPLKDRINIILTRDINYKVENAIICNSISELFLKIKKYNSEDIFVIGGEQIYKLLLPYCNIVYVTKIKEVYDADTFFPNLDNNKDWDLIKESDIKSYKDTSFQYTVYKNNNIKKINF